MCIWINLYSLHNNYNLIEISLPRMQENGCTFLFYFFIFHSIFFIFIFMTRCALVFSTSASDKLREISPHGRRGDPAPHQLDRLGERSGGGDSSRASAAHLARLVRVRECRRAGKTGKGERGGAERVLILMTIPTVAATSMQWVCTYGIAEASNPPPSPPHPSPPYG